MFDCGYDLSLWHWVTRQAILVAETMPEVCGTTLFPHEVAQWKATLPLLASYAVGKGWPAGEKGYAVGAYDGHPNGSVSLDSMQRHFSHLFMIFPLHNIRYTGADAETKAIMSASVDWYAHYDPPNGFSKVGIAAMSQSLDGSQARSDFAWGNLTSVLHLGNISPNAQYWESNHAPCNESPLGWAFAASQTFVRSWQDGVIEVFPAVPSRLKNVELAGVLTEGAFLVSARRAAGVTEWVRVEVAARPGATASTHVNCSINVDSSMAQPWSFNASRGVTLRAGATAGAADVLGMRVGDSISLWSKAKGEPTRPMLATPVAAGPDDINQWGKHSAHASPTPKMGHKSDEDDVTAAAPADDCKPHIHWLSQGVDAGETLMVAGWCFGPNATLLLDGKLKLGMASGIGVGARNGYSLARALMSNPLPATVTPGRHTVAVQTAAGQTSNAVSLNDAELWWVQGDEGVAASAGGWIRAFGRELIDRGAALPASPPAALRQAYQEFARLGGWDVDVQLERLRALMANHGDWLTHELDAAAPTTTLLLTPMGGGKPLPLAATAGSTSTFSARFAVPVGTAPGEYRVSLRSGAGGAESLLDCFENLNRPRVHTIVIEPAQPALATRPTFFVDGPSGVNITSDPWQTPPFGTVGLAEPIDATPGLLAALAKAAASPVGATVRFRAGLFHINGPIIVPNNVSIVGAGSDLTAIYFAYDNLTTAPQILIGPSAAANSWAISDVTLYVLGFFRTVIHIPADETGQGRFRMNRVTVRADAFHCQNGMMGHGGGRSPPWFPNCDSTCGTGGGYENAVIHLGRLENVSHTQDPVIADLSTGVKNTPAVNVHVEDCDISSSWHIFQGAVQHFGARNIKLWNGGMAFYLIARESIIEGNDAAGSSVISGGGGYNFAQHLYHGNNRIRNIHGNDREVMTVTDQDP
jgi:hypothetical protein